MLRLCLILLAFTFCSCLIAGANPTLARLKAMPADTRVLRIKLIDDAAAAALKRFSQLEVLDLEDWPESEGAIQAIYGLSSLRVLRLGERVHVEGAQLDGIEKLDRLEEFSMEQLGWELSDNNLRALLSLKNLRRLKLVNFEGSAEWLAGLSALGRLEALSLTYATQLTDSMVGSLTACRNLKALRLVRCELLTPAVFDQLSKMTWLEELHIDPWMWRPPDFLDSYYTTWTGKDVAKLAPLQNLRYLNIRGSAQLVDNDMDVFAGFMHLEILDVSDCTGLTDAGIAKLAALPNLISLIAYGLHSSVKGTGFRAFSGAPLRRLDLSHGMSLSSEGLRAIAGIPHLRALSLTNIFSQIEMTSFSSLADAPELRELDLRLDSLSVEACRALAASKVVEVLGLAAPMNNKHIAALSGLTQLRELRLETGKEVEDAAFSGFSKLELLELLVVDSASVTRKLFGHLAACSSLRHLEIKHCAKMGSDGLGGVERLKQLERLHLWECPELPGSAHADLAKCTKLRELEVDCAGATAVEDLLPLRALKELETLKLGGCTNSVVEELSKLIPMSAVSH